MPNYNCPRCNYSTTRKSNFKTHIESKTPCVVIEGGIDISRDKLLNIISSETNLLDEYIKAIVEINYLKEENLKLKQDNSTNYDIKNNTEAINICNGDDNNIININFIMNNYNEPNTAYILSKHADAALRDGNLVEGCIQMARLIWFNGNHPENHSIFKTNQKNKNIKCLEDGKINQYSLNSKFKDIMIVILDVFERAEKESDKYYDLNDIFDKPDKYPEFYRRLETDLSNELYNHKELVKETIAKFQHK